MATPPKPPESKYAIHAAARDSRTQAVESLLTTSPRLAYLEDPDARLPLHWAATSSSLPIIRLLSSLPRFDPDATDAAGWSASMIASSLPNSSGLEILEFLATKDADFSVQSSSGVSAVHLASSKGNLDVVKFLLEKKRGGSARTRDKRGQTPLHRAAAVGSLSIVRVLLENGGVMNASDADGMTALHHALAEGHGDVAVELLGRGAEAGKTDSEGRTAMQCVSDARVEGFVRAWGEREGFAVE